MITLYGIATCSSCRQARHWLAERGIDYHWHDIRSDGLNLERLDRWLSAVGWEALLNRRGRSWRELPAGQRTALDISKARTLLVQQPLLIKRPVLELDDQVWVGFDAPAWSAVLIQHGNA